MTGDLGDTPVAGSPVTTLPAFLALGDSYSIGQGVEAGGRWPVQLARALRLEGRDLGEPRIVAGGAKAKLNAHFRNGDRTTR